MNEQPIFWAGSEAKLDPGDVAVIIRKDGNIQIAHRIESIHETGMVTGGPDAAGIILAMTMVNVVEEDENALMAGMKRVVSRLEGGGMKLVEH